MGRVNLLMLAVLVVVCACGLSESANYDSYESELETTTLPPADEPSTRMYKKKAHRRRTTTPLPTTTLPTIRTTPLADEELSTSKPSSSFSCADREPGMYPAADGACKNMFYVCEPEADWALEFDCASPDTYFDETSGFCLEKEYVPACGGIATTTMLPLIVPKEIPFPFDCSMKEDGDYAKDNECSKMYVSCSGGESTYRNCPADTYFDIESGECLEKEWVKVCGGELTTRMPETTVAYDSSYDCSGKADGYYPSDSCSPLFYSCSGGHTRAMKCAGHSKLKFDIDSQMCLLDRYVSACGGKATTTTEIPPRDSSLPQISCKDKEPGVYEDPTAQRSSNGGVCSSLYITCLPDAVDAIVSKCPEGTMYDMTVDQCQYDWNVTACAKVEQKPRPRPTKPRYEDESVTEAAYTTKAMRTTRYKKPTTTTEATTTIIADEPLTEASYTTKAAKPRRHRIKTTTTEAPTTTTIADEPSTEAAYTTKKMRPSRRTTTTELPTTTTEATTTTLADEPSTEDAYATTKRFRPSRRTTMSPPADEAKPY